MAIDTEAKRRSAGTHMVTLVLPPADSSVDQGDRQQVAFLYRGVPASGASAGSGGLRADFHWGKP
jgi:hypothetical protein